MTTECAEDSKESFLHQKEASYSYKINESQRWNVQHGEYVKYTVISLVTDITGLIVIIL